MAEAYTGNNISLEDKVAAAQEQLKKQGFAVIDNVLTAEECDEGITQIHQWLAGFGDGHFPKNIGSVIHCYKVGFLDCVWKVRLKTLPIFAQLWGTRKLLSSIDGIAVGEPPEISTVHHFGKEDDHNLHYDQNDQRVGLHGIQGAVYLEQADERDWCFMVLPKSHLHHDEFFHNFAPNPRSEFRPLKVKEVKWFRDRGIVPTRVTCPRGGMILWDSRTVHSGAKPLWGRAEARWRYVIFSCMAPAAWATPKDAEIKKAAYHKRLLTRHWPCNGVGTFRASSRVDEHDVPITEIINTPEVRRIAGDLPYDFEDGEPNGPPAPSWATEGD